MLNSIKLAFDFAKRDFKERYVGTGLGEIWYLLSPVITIFIYTVIFSDFMKMKLDIVENHYAYSIYLVPGLLAWTAFSTIILRLTNSIFEKAGLIKKISVPVYSFQLAMVMTEFLVFLISMSLGVGFLILVDQPVTWTFLWLLPVMVLQTIFALGIGVILSVFTPFFRDLKEAVPIVIQLWFWATPIIYLKSMIEDKYPAIITYNPFYYFVEIYQNIFLHHQAPTLHSLLIISMLAFTTLFIAIFFYKKLMGAIKDVI